MSKFNLSKIANNIGLTLSKHSPEILMGIGIAGMISATVLAVKTTPKAVELINQEKKRQNKELRKEAEKNGSESYPKVDKLTPIDTIKTTWKCYVPTVATTALSTACLISSSRINTKRNAALATAYALSETALREYKDKVIETIGEKKEQGIRDKIAKDHVEKNPVSANEIIITGNGEHLCYDLISGRYFYSDIEKIRRVENILNKKLMDEMYISLNDFYFELGLQCTNLGNEMGWNIDDGLIDFHFSSQLSDEEKPCLVIDYHIAPRYDYRKLM